MRVMVLGANGMLGHKLIQTLSEHFDVIGTVRDDAKNFSQHPVLGSMELLGNVCADQFDSVRKAIDFYGPDYVVNCIGIVKQLPSAHDAIASITINALFPHQLAQYCRDSGTRVVHYSTDCIFSGNVGNYKEEDFPDATDLYGRTKYLGEVDYENCLTLRTSIIGRELGKSHSLIEWFIAQNGKCIKGYTKAIFSGLTTKVHGDILSQIFRQWPQLSGIYHLAAKPISKYALLSLVKEKYGLDITIEPDETVVCDRSLDGSKFFQKTGLAPPDWDRMIEDMLVDEKSYHSLRN
jgi:dTDP-4-dehydrorhamnose reductase